MIQNVGRRWLVSILALTSLAVVILTLAPYSDNSMAAEKILSSIRNRELVSDEEFIFLIESVADYEFWKVPVFPVEFDGKSVVVRAIAIDLNGNRRFDWSRVMAIDTTGRIYHCKGDNFNSLIKSCEEFILSSPAAQRNQRMLYVFLSDLDKLTGTKPARWRYWKRPAEMPKETFPCPLDTPSPQNYPRLTRLNFNSRSHVNGSFIFQGKCYNFKVENR